jgi:hypothetical protein
MVLKSIPNKFIPVPSMGLPLFSGRTMPHFSFHRPLGTPGKIAAQLREKFEILMATMVCSGLGMINSGFLGEMLIFCFFHNFDEI